jgi:hypothetical protein
MASAAYAVIQFVPRANRVIVRRVVGGFSDTLGGCLFAIENGYSHYLVLPTPHPLPPLRPSPSPFRSVRHR